MPHASGVRRSVTAITYGDDRTLCERNYYALAPPFKRSTKGPPGSTFCPNMTILCQQTTPKICIFCFYCMIWFPPYLLIIDLLAADSIQHAVYLQTYLKERYLRTTRRTTSTSINPGEHSSNVSNVKRFWIQTITNTTTSPKSIVADFLPYTLDIANPTDAWMVFTYMKRASTPATSNLPPIVTYNQHLCRSKVSHADLYTCVLCSLFLRSVNYFYAVRATVFVLWFRSNCRTIFFLTGVIVENVIQAVVFISFYFEIKCLSSEHEVFLVPPRTY
jgi:hypothetical protein